MLELHEAGGRATLLHEVGRESVTTWQDCRDGDEGPGEQEG